MSRMIIAGVLALGGLMTTALGVAHADEIQVDRVYATLAACEVDGPYVKVSHNDNQWTSWDCRQRGDGLYYLYLTN